MKMIDPWIRADEKINEFIEEWQKAVKQKDGLKYNKEEIKKKENTNMKVCTVKFKGSEKNYCYFCKVSMQVGSVYNITADYYQTYSNPVTVIEIREANEYDMGKWRVITHATLVDGAKRPDDRIKRVIFNREKRTTVVIWWDNMKTILKLQDGDQWDEEKALALCYMKRVLGNRGSFNETLKRYCAVPDYRLNKEDAPAPSTEEKGDTSEFAVDASVFGNAFVETIDKFIEKSKM